MPPDITCKDSKQCFNRYFKVSMLKATVLFDIASNSVDGLPIRLIPAATLTVVTPNRLFPYLFFFIFKIYLSDVCLIKYKIGLS